MNVGIDLGTTYSAVAYFDKNKGEAVVLSNSEAEKTTPSVTNVEGGVVTIGNAAKNAMGAGDCNSAAFYKSMMGEDYTVYLDGKNYSAEDLSAMFLKELIKDIEKANGVKIDGAVITCPAYFDEKRRMATLNAGKRAGLNVLKIINEPTAAIIAYGLTGGKKKTVMVYDLGGGTFDVTIAEINGTRVSVLTTNGDHTLGGRDWDGVLTSYFAALFENEYGIDINGSPEDLSELQVACEGLKKKLSTMKEASIIVRSGGCTGRYKITAEEFDARTESLLNQTEMLIEKCFADMEKNGRSGFGWKNIDEVVLVGGSTRMPQVRRLITERFGKQPVTANINVDTIVAAGAAIQAELCTSNTLTLGGTAAPKGSSAPRIGGLTISSSDIEDITAHSLGMLAYKKEDGSIINSIILKKDSKTGVPVTRNYNFKGKELNAYVLQGESENPYESNLLYQYLITGMDATRKNDIDVAFLYNQNGIVEVTAVTREGRSLSVAKQPITETLEEIIARLLKEAEQKPAAQKVQVLMILDVSGSMSGNSIHEAKNAMTAFASACDYDSMEIAIVKFADRSAYQLKFTNNKNKIMQSISNIEVDGRVGYGTEGKNLFSDYERDFSRGADSRIVIVLTDGEWCSESIAIKQAGHMKGDGITIYAIGVEGANYAFLQQIASPGCARKVDPSELIQAFGDIASSIATEN